MRRKGGCAEVWRSFSKFLISVNVYEWKNVDGMMMDI